MSTPNHQGKDKDKLQLHVCEQQILERIIDGATEDPRVGQCAICNHEVAKITQALTGFHAAIDRWSTREYRPSPRPAVDHVLHATMHGARWAVAFAILVVVALVPIYRHEQDQKHEAELRANAELLRQVETDLSEDVSPAMEPLLKMTTQDVQSNQTAIRPAKQ